MTSVEGRKEEEGKEIKEKAIRPFGEEEKRSPSESLTGWCNLEELHD